MDFALVGLAAETVAKLVDDFHHGQGRPHVDDGLQAEEFVVGRQLAPEGVEVGGHQHEGPHNHRQAADEEPGSEDPPQVLQHPAQELFRVENGDLDVQDVGERLHPFAAFAFLAAIEQLFAGLGRFVLGQAGRQKLLAELFQVFELEPFGTEAFFVFFLGLVQRVRTVHELEQVVLLFLETVVAHADGVLDDEVGSPLVLLRLDRQIGARHRRTCLRRSRSAGSAVCSAMSASPAGVRGQGSGVRLRGQGSGARLRGQGSGVRVRSLISDPDP